MFRFRDEPPRPKTWIRRVGLSSKQRESLGETAFADMGGARGFTHGPALSSLYW
jgi:hypothetical protein